MEGERIEIRVSENERKERLDIFLTKKIPRISRNQLQKFIKEGYIKVDGFKAKSNHNIHPSEVIEIFLPKPPPTDILPESIPLEIVYEDEFLMVINKKAGMVVHPACGHFTGTLVNALLAKNTPLSKESLPVRPGIVHRLDKDTSGLLVVAKDEFIHNELAKQFSLKSVKREYIALVWRTINENKGTIETFLSRNIKDRRKMAVSQSGKKAVTHFTVLKRYPLLTYLNLRLDTGRTHQIRVHLSFIGHPVFGDQTYGGRSKQLIGLNKLEMLTGTELLKIMTRQALHAKTLGFIHPVTMQKLEFDSKIPDDISRTIDFLKNVQYLRQS